MTTVFFRPRTLIILGSVLLVVLVVASTIFAFTQFGGQGNQAQKPPNQVGSSAIKVDKQKTVKSVVVPSPSPPPPPHFSFTAAGDYGQTSYTTANLNYIGHAHVNFHLGLGDFDYDPNSSAAAWSTYAKSHLPANFPFEIVAGGHDLQIDTLAANLPDHLGNISGIYAKEYSFDYPPNAPLARFIITSPSQILPGYDYGKGTMHYNWVAQKIDSARAAHIHWVIVGMHQFCFVIDSTSCANQDLLDLLISKKVDLILQAQKHTYQASKQLNLSTACPFLPITSYNPHCIVNATNRFAKGLGPVIVVSGTGGTVPLLSINTADPKINYFRSWMGANVNQSFGVSQFTISPTSLTEHFVGVTGSFSDSFTING